jgi:ectoine hydroxylase-related dioxygenase (phytanoyl-CoA dioxygenase family)
MKIISYVVSDFDFAKIITDHLGYADLSLIHKGVHYPLFSRHNDQGTIFHRKLYSIGMEFFAMYTRFVREVIQPQIGGSFIYQRIPTFRVHLPNNVSVGEFHRDRDYFHSPHETNIWLPVTDTWDTNTVWIESDEGREDYRPYELSYGQALIFDGANLKHGNMINQTGHTRVSLDFRVMPFGKYESNERRSINTKMRFVLGEYFTKFED